MRIGLLVAVVVLLAACAGTPTAPEAPKCVTTSGDSVGIWVYVCAGAICRQACSDTTGTGGGGR